MRLADFDNTAQNGQRPRGERRSMLLSPPGDIPRTPYKSQRPVRLEHRRLPREASNQQPVSCVQYGP